MRRQVKVQKQSGVYTTAKIAYLKDFEICRSDLEISADGHVRQRTLSLLRERNKNIPTILAEIPG
jgi:hypothetical protein